MATSSQSVRFYILYQNRSINRLQKFVNFWNTFYPDQVLSLALERVQLQFILRIVITVICGPKTLEFNQWFGKRTSLIQWCWEQKGFEATSSCNNTITINSTVTALIRIISFRPLLYSNALTGERATNAIGLCYVVSTPSLTVWHCH